MVEEASNSDDFYLLLNANKLNRGQISQLELKLMGYIAKSMDEPDVENHEKINKCLEILSENKISYHYPFDKILSITGTIRLHRQALLDSPEQILEAIVKSKKFPSVVFLGELGMDAGGLTRDLVGYLIDGLSKDDGVLNVDVELGLPMVSSDNEKRKNLLNDLILNYFLAQP